MKKAVIGSLILSILHSILFVEKSFGVSVILFAIPSVILLIILLKKHNIVKNTNAFYLAIPIILLSLTYFIFNNNFFNIMNAIVIILLYGIMIVWATTDTFKIRILFSKAINLVIGSLEFIPNSIKQIKETFKFKKKDTKSEKKRQIWIGILCSLPILLILFALLVSADGIFASLFGIVSEKIMEIFTKDIFVSLLLRIVVFIIIFVYLVCVIYNILNKESSYNKVKVKELKKNINIEGITVNTVLTAINILYLLFSIVQFVYVFSYISGVSRFVNDSDLSKYARQGFFQLMLVSFINFIIIILINLNKNEMSDKTKKYTKIMNVIMAIFTFIIAISAFMRMYLYEKEFGYTFQRLMVYVILLTEMIMIIPTIIYIVKGKINLFKSYFIIVLTMYVIVNFINIDAMIAKNNVNRYINSTDEKKKIDITYLINNTGTDAIPELVKVYDKLENETQIRRLNNYLYNTYQTEKRDKSWQEFNISKVKAENILKDMNLEYMKYKSKKQKSII